MGASIENFDDIVKRLNSEDPFERRTAAEDLMNAEIPNDLAKMLASRLTDDDPGVRDAVGTTLTFNENPMIPEFVVPFISSDDIAVRNLAGDILNKRGDGSIEAMVAYLDSGDDDDKKFIIDILALIGNDSPKEKILTILKETANDNVILACIEALGSMRVDEATDDLIEIFDKNELFRPTIIESFGKIGSQKVLEFLFDQFEKVDDLTRFSMLETLGDIGKEDTFFFLLGLLKKAQPPLNWAIVQSLKKLRDKLDLDIPFDEGTRDAILNTLSDADEDYQVAASSMLAYFVDDEVVDACIEQYGKNATIDQNLGMIFRNSPAIFYKQFPSHIGQSQENVLSLLEFFRDMIEEDGGEELSKVDQLVLHTLNERLAEVLSHPAEEVRKITMELLFFVSPETAFVFMDTMVSDSNMWNRMRLLEVLEFLHQQPEYKEDAKSALETLKGDEEEMIRQRAEAILNS